MIKSDAISLINIRGKEIIAFGGLISPANVEINHKVKLGGVSFTDGKNMETGLPEFMVDDSEDEFNPTFTPSKGLFVLKALTAHEYGHVWFSKFTDCAQFNLKMGEKLEQEAGINLQLAIRTVQHILNCTEDGRIEKRMSNLYPGLLNYFRYLNGISWQRDTEEVPSEIDPSTGKNKKELNNFLHCIVDYAVVGIKPRWYKNTKSTRLRDEFEKIESLIDDCIDARTCKKNTEITEKIIETSWDYLVELLTDIQNNQEEMDNFMNSLGDGDIQEGTEGVADGSNKGSGSSSPRLSSEGDEGDDGEDGTGTTKGDEGEDTGEGSLNAVEENEDGEGDNSGSAYSSKGNKTKAKYKDTYETSKDKSQYGRENISGDGGGSTKTIKSKTPEELIQDMIEESSESADKEAETVTSKPPKKEVEDSSSITQSEISKMITDVGYDKEHIREYCEVKGKYSMKDIPSQLRPQAVKFRRDVEKCFSQKNTRLSKMTSGRLDCRQLHRIGMQEYNLFEKIANRSDTDAVVEICWDGSGSMYGGKQNLSADACSIIEYGLKGMVPLKIINFSTNYDTVLHYLVKNFDDSDKHISYSTSYSKSKGFNGGNKDGYSIRVCTQELLKRPEKDKILIVLSDGLPSDYNSINPEDDVKDAVKCARRKGIVVIPIFFGDDYFRNDERTLNAYQYMYEKHIINSSPEELGNRLVKLLKSLVLK